MSDFASLVNNVACSFEASTGQKPTALYLGQDEAQRAIHMFRLLTSTLYPTDSLLRDPPLTVGRWIKSNMAGNKRWQMMGLDVYLVDAKTHLAVG